MKTRMLLFAGLALQICFLLFILVQAPEPLGAIKVGLQRLKENAPSQAATIEESGGAGVLKTAGDFFYEAGDWSRFIFLATIGFTMMSIIITILMMITLREKAKTTET